MHNFDDLHNFDDSSDEEDVIEKLDQNISENWKSFSREVLDDLKQRTKLLNDGEKSNDQSLFSMLNAVKSDTTILEKGNIVLDQITAVLPELTSDALAKEKCTNPNTDDVKQKVNNHHKILSSKIEKIFNEFNEFINKKSIKFIVSNFKNEKITRFKFKTYGKKISDNVGYDALLKQAVEQLNIWLTSEKNKINFLIKVIEDIKNTLLKIDGFIAISAPEVDETCKLSFVAHYIGTALLHHSEIARIYSEDKKQYLMNEQMKKDFQYTLFSSSILLKSLIEFNKICSANLGCKLVSENLLHEQLMELQKNQNLRLLLKKMNSLNDYLLLRRMYDCIDKIQISFAHFIKRSSQEIIDLIKEKHPIFKIDYAKLCYVEAFNNSNDIEVQVIKSNNKYQYGNYGGYIDTSLFHTEDEIKNIILDINADPLAVKIYNICKERKFDSAKKFYTQLVDSDIYLIEDTMKLILGLPDPRSAKLKLTETELTSEDRVRVQQGKLVSIQICNKQELTYRIYMLNTENIYKIEDKLFNDIVNKYSQEADDYQGSKNDSYLRNFIIDKVEEANNLELYFESKRIQARIVQIFLGNSKHQSLSVNRPADDILQHAFMLVLRREVYKIVSLERVVLPETFKFTTTSPAEFLSNIRLCNRSLTRHSRNLLQNPNTCIQIDTLNSGSAPLVSIAKTWHFATNKAEALTKMSFFAVDRQILNSKRSEKKKTHLSREHYVAEVGAYSEIHETFLKEKYLKKNQSSLIAKAILKPIEDPNIEDQIQVPIEANFIFYFANLFYLLFGVESIRNPAMLVINMMLLDLLREECIKIDQLFSGNNVVQLKDTNYYYINGLMPTAPKSITARSREINNLYHRYMLNPYVYPGDLSRSAQGVPSTRDEDTKLKLGLNHLMYRESLVVTMWFKHKTGKDIKNETIENIAQEITESAEKWWYLKKS